MKKPRWVSGAALVLLHSESLAEHGGMWGFRDEAAFEAALARPHQVYNYERDADLARLAAAYGFGLVRGHAFNDGNKRVGFLAVGLFLALNGFPLEEDPAEAFATIVGLAAGKVSETAFSQWIRTRMVRRK